MIIIITGGIGSGKSVVSQILMNMGFRVYDCDTRAKALMNKSSLIKESIIKNFGENSYLTAGGLNREYISSIIFNNKSALKLINGIVHPEVKADILHEYKSEDKCVFFVETAIMEESGLDAIADRVWIVDSPIDLRIKRVMKRNKMSEDDVRHRIASQSLLTDLKVPNDIITNDDRSPLLPRIESLVKDLIMDI